MSELNSDIITPILKGILHPGGGKQFINYQSISFDSQLINTRVWWDTGATCSLISKEFMERYCLANRNSLKNYNLIGFGSSNQPLEQPKIVNGVVNFERLNKYSFEISLLISDHAILGNCDVLLGSDYIGKDITVTFGTELSFGIPESKKVKDMSRANILTDTNNAIDELLSVYSLKAVKNIIDEIFSKKFLQKKSQKNKGAKTTLQKTDNVGALSATTTNIADGNTQLDAVHSTQGRPMASSSGIHGKMVWIINMGEDLPRARGLLLIWAIQVAMWMLNLKCWL